MHVNRFLKKWLEGNCEFMHRARAAALVRVVEGLLRGHRLSLTALGRSLWGRSHEKHRIKCVDRLLGNANLQRERMQVYRALAHWLLRDVPRPVVLVDWSDGHTGREWLLLRAAVPLGGRALTVYEEVHRLSAYGSAAVHRRFLGHLQRVLPAQCCPVIVTDAGFRGPWFRAVEQRGWDWVGRIRGRVYLYLDASGRWSPVKALYARARRQPQCLGHGLLYQGRSLACQFYLARRYRRATGPRVPRRGLPALARYCRRHYAEPWLLASSLPEAPGQSERVMGLYAQRMSIEESFRDLKSQRWGFAARDARSHCTERLQVLLLVSTLAALTVWVVGLAAKARGWLRHFQANTERQRPVLSIAFLGRQVLRAPHLRIRLAELSQSTQQLFALVREHAYDT